MIKHGIDQIIHNEMTTHCQMNKMSIDEILNRGKEASSINH